jgi:two-component system, LytTR family, sensor kinase
MAWIAYVAAWLAAAMFWSLAGAMTTRTSPLETLRFGLLAMGSAGVMGLFVWRLTERVAWNWRAPSFWIVHAVGASVFAMVYATSWSWPDLLAGKFDVVRQSYRMVLGWNLMMGSWLYIVVAGVSYTIRAQRRVHAQEAAAADARLLAQQAQLAALRAQVNPHFLFNALHSVGALVTCDPVRADQALERLGDLLRYALGSEEQVPFGHEWRFTKDYLAFEQLRLGDRLQVDAHVDANTYSTLVPPLILQPLVENAVRHGIADRPEGGRIELRARVDNAQLVVSVVDDGHGSGNGGGASDGFGMGLIQHRLKALYGERASLCVNVVPTGFSVTIALPVRQADDWEADA